MYLRRCCGRATAPGRAYAERPQRPGCLSSNSPGWPGALPPRQLRARRRAIVERHAAMLAPAAPPSTQSTAPLRAPPWPPSTPATRYFVQLLCPCTEAVDCLDSFSHSGSWCHCAAFQDQPWRTVDSRRCACCCARRAPSGTPRAGRARLRGQWRFARWGERRWATSAKRRHGKRPPSIHLTNNSPIFSRSRPLVSGRLK
jgi:hypothetical protein